MDPVVHGMLAWLFAIIFIRDVRDRRLVVIAGVIPDIDGIYILYSTELFYLYHHTWGHSFIFALPVAIFLALFGREKRQVFLGALGAFSVHLISDYFGSNWNIPPLWPISDREYTSATYLSDHVIYDIINPVVTVAALICILIIAYRKEISPIEFISTKLDKKIVGMLIYPLKYKCAICGGWAFVQCDECGRKICAEHLPNLREWKCSECLEKPDKEQSPT